MSCFSVKIASCFLFVVFFVCSCNGEDDEAFSIGPWEFPARPRPLATFTEDKTNLSCGPIQSVVEELVSFIRTNRTDELLPLFLHPSLESWNQLFQKHRWGQHPIITVVGTMGDIKGTILGSLRASSTIIRPNNAYFFLTVLFDLALSQIYAGKWGAPLPRYMQTPLGPISSGGYPRPLFVDLVASFGSYGCLYFLKETLSKKEGKFGKRGAYFLNLKLFYDKAAKAKPSAPSLMEELNFGDPDCKRRTMLAAQLLLTTDLFWHDVNRILQ